MITYVDGNLFESPASTLVNTVNTVGVMGKGVAAEFKRLYP
jgi:O-acetyl-ADP-ribose deacetylase (regulator of RNase III)